MKKIIILLLSLQSMSFGQSLNHNLVADDRTELHYSNVELKSHRRFGIGLMVGGTTGLIGLNGEINIEPTDAAVIGIGLGPQYSSFNLGWKHNFLGNYISPYTKVGYAKWFNTSGGENSAKDSDILKRILTAEELRQNRFSADFIVGSVGLEYNQLEGELSGVNLFGEFVMMAEMKKGIFIPTGAVGLTYYY